MYLFGAMILGAALLMGGFLFGYRMRKRDIQTEPAKKRTRKLKCYVIEPKDFGEEERTE